MCKYRIVFHVEGMYYTAEYKRFLFWRSCAYSYYAYGMFREPSKYASHGRALQILLSHRRNRSN